MSMSVVWVDLEKAKLFHFSEDRMEREMLFAARVDPDFAIPDFAIYDEIAEKLSPAHRVLILGPGIARIHLNNRLKEKFPLIAKRVVGCESSEHPTDDQIAAHAMKYFQKPVA